VSGISVAYIYTMNIAIMLYKWNMFNLFTLYMFWYLVIL